MDQSAAPLTVADLGVILTVTALVLIAAVAAVRLSARTGLPSLLLYLGLGIVIGPSGLGVHIDQIGMSLVLGYAALILILAEGGLTTSWPDIKGAIAPAALLSTVGIVVSVGIVGAAAHLLLHLDWRVSLLVGAILSSTDAAAVFSVLRDARPSARLSGILEAESGFNDAPVVLIVVFLAEQLVPGAPAVSFSGIVLLVLVELVGGAAIGLLVGFLAAAIMRRLGSSASGLFPIGVLSWVVLSYGLATFAHTSGFIAVYLCGLVLGNVALPHRSTIRGFAQALGWLAQIGLFVMLGLLVSPDRIIDQVVPAIVLGLVLLLVARPASVTASVIWFRIPIREQMFLSWAGLRGAVPIVLATVPIIVGAPGVDWIFNLVVMLVVVFLLVQAPVLPLLARLLGVTDPEHARHLDIDNTPLEELGADLLEVTIGERSRLHGVEIFELRLPPGAEVSLISRDGAAFVPSAHTPLRRDDRLLIIVPFGLHETVVRRLHAVDEVGRLAGWIRSGAHRPRATGR